MIESDRGRASVDQRAASRRQGRQENDKAPGEDGGVPRGVCVYSVCSVSRVEEDL